jgi:hypothetical protein
MSLGQPLGPFERHESSSQYRHAKDFGPASNRFTDPTENVITKVPAFRFFPLLKRFINRANLAHCRNGTIFDEGDKKG